jgi:NhaP-type Na+/H+ or K+/H+ antiporter
MDLKNKPTWLKGGIIGFIIGIIAILLSYIQIITMLGLFLAMPSWGLISLILHFLIPEVTFDTAGAIGLWLSPIIYFLYGAIIGWVINKISKWTFGEKLDKNARELKKNKIRKKVFLGGIIGLVISIIPTIIISSNAIQIPDKSYFDIFIDNLLFNGFWLLIIGAIIGLIIGIIKEGKN